MTRFKVAENICTIFSLQNLSTFVQNITSLISRSNFSTKEYPSWKSFCHRNTRENATRFSTPIVIVCMHETRNEIMNDLSFDVTDGRPDIDG